MESPGRGGGNYVGGIDGSCTRIAEAVSNQESYVALLVPGLVG